MKLKKAFWNGDRWYEAGEDCPDGSEKRAKLQGALVDDKPQVKAPAANK